MTERDAGIIRDEDPADKIAAEKKSLVTDSTSAVESLLGTPILGAMIRARLTKFRTRCEKAGLSVDDAEDVVIAIWRRVRNLFDSK